jgi:hypothetical protein
MHVATSVVHVTNLLPIVSMLLLMLRMLLPALGVVLPTVCFVLPMYYCVTTCAANVTATWAMQVISTMDPSWTVLLLGRVVMRGDWGGSAVSTWTGLSSLYHN